jgi:gamma-glutamyltranspeptidase/glutathione hydrolase
MLNGAMSVFDPRPGRAGSIAPGKRRFASMAPSLVFEDGKPVMTLGAPGGTWITLGILQVLLNVLDWGMGMQEAVMAPRDCRHQRRDRHFQPVSRAPWKARWPGWDTR